VKNKNSLAIPLLAVFAFIGYAQAAEHATKPVTPSNLRSCTSEVSEPPIYVVLGKSTIVKLKEPVTRMVVGGTGSAGGGVTAAATGGVINVSQNPPRGMPAATSNDGVADTRVDLINSMELSILGKKVGSMNVVLQNASGRCIDMEFIVTVNPAPLQAELSDLMPEQTGIKVKSVQNALVLTGTVSDAVKLDNAMSLATSYFCNADGKCEDGKRVVNMLRVTSPQQVMLEVKIAEVSKTVVDKLGSSVNATRTSGGGGNVASLISNFLSNGGGLLQALRVGKYTVGLDGEKDDNVVRVLAEPNIMAISGQAASFLSGGKIFIPVPQNSGAGATTITLEEKEFGIGVHFTPTVLDGTRINLKLVSEVSELSQTGVPFSAINGVVSVIPLLTVRRADTTVQLNDGQSFVIAGLIKNNSTEGVNRFPGLGEVPILGALFRSSEFQKDQTELLFVVTPRLVAPLAEVPPLPTSSHVEPTRTDIYLYGGMELPGTPPATKQAKENP
jgi:pilus assembly protein CpaC